jgi:hypothetical protein
MDVQVMDAPMTDSPRSAASAADSDSIAEARGFAGRTMRRSFRRPQAEAVPARGFDMSLSLTLPPLGVLWLEPEPDV